MKKALIRTLCVAFCVLFCLTFLASCKAKPIYELGPYSLSEEDYKYLAGMYNRQILESNGLFGYSYDALDETTGLTIGQALDTNYSSAFAANVLSLLYSQMLFDKYNLELGDEMTSTIESNIKTIVSYYGNGSEQEFDILAKKFGYTTDSLRKVYTMRMKQTLLIEHLYGKDGEKIDSETYEKIYKDDYMFFQTIVINATYRLVEKEVDGKKTTVPVALSKEERKQRLDIIDDLSNLLVNPKDGYVYKVIDPTLSYEELYKLYSDDTAYPQGCYSKYPTVITAQNAITAAALLREGDTGKIVAKRPFPQDAVFDYGDEQITVEKGKTLNYGYAFVKRMPLGDAPYRQETYKTFFTSFVADVKNELFAEVVQNYMLYECNFELEEAKNIDEYPLSSVLANNLDYNFFYGDLGKKQESTSK